MNKVGSHCQKEAVLKEAPFLPLIWHEWPYTKGGAVFIRRDHCPGRLMIWWNYCVIKQSMEEGMKAAAGNSVADIGKAVEHYVYQEHTE